jgi:hypothetical protein
MKPTFSLRKATSLALFFSLFMLTLSGALLWIVPHFMSYGNSPVPWGINRAVWLQEHLVFSILFALLSFAHLFGFNREAMLTYLKKSAGPEGKTRPEFRTTLLMTGLIAFLTALHVPAISTDLNTNVRNAAAAEQNSTEAFLSTEEHEASERRLRHSHPEDDHVAGRWSASIADRGQVYKADDNAILTESTTGADTKAGAGAPDDELHRRTTTGCSSCH